MNNTLRMSKDEALGYIGDLYVGIDDLINKRQFTKAGPNPDKMFNLIVNTLDNIFIREPFLKEDRMAFKEVVDAYPTAYVVIDKVFSEYYEDDEQNRKICDLFREYVKSYLTGMSSIIGGYKDEDDVLVNEAKIFSGELKLKLYEELGVYFEEW